MILIVCYVSKFLVSVTLRFVNTYLKSYHWETWNLPKQVWVFVSVNLGLEKIYSRMLFGSLIQGPYKREPWTL